MARHSDDIDRSASLASAGARRGLAGGLAFARAVARRRGALIAFAAAGFLLGLVYRLDFDPESERTVANFLRSGAHGVGLVLTVWAVRTASRAGGRFGAALRRLPLVMDVLLRALAMTAALILVGLALELLLYGEPDRIWMTNSLPRIVAAAFGFSIVLGVAVELGRLIGAPLLTSVLLGTYHRPTRRRLIVMFLDLAHSTQLAEAMGELKVHDLITRFFFDIDGPIADHGGAVHAYVGDGVIVSWPVSADPRRNARAVSCFLAIERKIGALAPAYEAEFGVVPAFRAGVHTGSVVVSECGDAKRQLAFFGDTMNVAARLCEYCKGIEARLVISGEAARLMALPPGVVVEAATMVAARGRREPVEAHVVEARPQGR
jgi:class 3 adenylate cyclase